MFLVRWEGGAPPDKVEWLAAVREALADESGSYRVRFHHEPNGWRFDLECRSAPGSDEPAERKADEGVALNVYTLLAESGKPLDPEWDPLAPAPQEAPPTEPPAPTAPRDPEVPAAAILEVGPVPEQAPPEAHPDARESALPAASRPLRWAGLRLASGRLVTIVLALSAGWLAWDKLRTPPASPSPPAAPSAEARAAQERLTQLEAVVAQLRKEKEEGARRAPEASPPPRAVAPSEPARPRGVPPVPVPSLAAPALATPTPEPPPAPTPTPEPPPTTTPAPPPVEPGALVEVADPGVTPPVLVAQAQPRYPPLARQRGIAGTVVVSALVDETGKVVDVSLVRVEPRGMGFEDAATRYVKSRRYRPAMRGEVPVRVRLEVAVEFRKPTTR